MGALYVSDTDVFIIGGAYAPAVGATGSEGGL